MPLIAVRSAKYFVPPDFWEQRPGAPMFRLGLALAGEGVPPRWCRLRLELAIPLEDRRAITTPNRMAQNRDINTLTAPVW